MTISKLSQAIRLLVTLVFIAVVGLYAGPARSETAQTETRSNAQLEQLVAPIALYPDSLMSQILMAATYPLEVVEAARWSKENASVTGPALETAMQGQSWDPSVKALATVPQVLAMMNDKLDWTQQLGDAFLAQQEDVLNAVQRLRTRAAANGQLDSNEHLKVTKLDPPPSRAPAGGTARSSAPAQPMFVIESASPEQYFVPIYDPTTVFGPWAYADYTPFFWSPPGFYYGGRGLAFAAGVITGAAIWGGVDWRRNRVDVNVNNFNRFNRTNIRSNTWAHNPAHRRGVPYRDQGVAQRFGDQSRAAARESFRGKADAGRRDLSKQGGTNRIQQGTGNRTGGQAKANAGRARDAAGARQGASARKGAQTRQASGANRAGQAKQAARSRQATQGRQATRPSAQRAAQGAQAHRAAGRPAGARPAGVNRTMQARPAGMRSGAARGGARGGGMRGGRR
jgi:hypothetical protein